MSVTLTIYINCFPLFEEGYTSVSGEKMFESNDDIYVNVYCPDPNIFINMNLDNLRFFQLNETLLQ